MTLKVSVGTPSVFDWQENKGNPSQPPLLALHSQPATLA